MDYVYRPYTVVFVTLRLLGFSPRYLCTNCTNTPMHEYRSLIPLQPSEVRNWDFTPFPFNFFYVFKTYCAQCRIDGFEQENNEKYTFISNTSFCKMSFQKLSYFGQSKR